MKKFNSNREIEEYLISRQLKREKLERKLLEKHGKETNKLLKEVLKSQKSILKELKK